MNRRKITTAMTLALLTTGFVTAAETKKSASKKQVNCPVMQRTPIDPALYIDVKGKRIYVCCKGCMAQVRGNPDKYIKRLEDKGVIIEKAPEKESEKKQG